jgi:hypothetical protein
VCVCVFLFCVCVCVSVLCVCVCVCVCVCLYANTHSQHARSYSHSPSASNRKCHCFHHKVFVCFIFVCHLLLITLIKKLFCVLEMLQRVLLIYTQIDSYIVICKFVDCNCLFVVWCKLTTFNLGSNNTVLFFVFVFCNFLCKS